MTKKDYDMRDAGDPMINSMRSARALRYNCYPSSSSRSGVFRDKAFSPGVQERAQSYPVSRLDIG